MPICLNAQRVGPDISTHERNVGADFNVREGVSVAIDADRREVIQ